MERIELYESCKNVIDSFLDDLNANNREKLENKYKDLFYYRFFSNHELREEIADLIPNENVECISLTLDVIRTHYSDFSGDTFSGQRGKITRKNAIDNLSYLSGLLANAIKRHNDSIVEINLNYFLDDLALIARLMQANHLYMNAEENNRNDYVRDLLEFKGYIVKDQTRHGLSSTGKDSGEVDILICKNKIQKESVIEGLNLSSCDNTKIQEHYSKIFKYDTAGNDYNVMIVYANVSDFPKFVLAYKRSIEKRNNPPCNQVEILRKDDSSTISLMKSYHSRNGNETCIYHLLIDFLNK